MQDQVSDSYIIANHLELDSDFEDLGKLAVGMEHSSFDPPVLSQITDRDIPTVAGLVEAADGQTIPISIGKTDIGNGRPRPFIHISDHPSIASRHITLTAMQTNDGKYRVMLRQNHPHTRVLLGGSLIRPGVAYPVSDNDQITLGDGVTFRVRLNNNEQVRQPRRSIGAGPTQPYIPSPDSEASHEAEIRDKEEKRRHFQERTTPDDSLLMQIAAAAATVDEDMHDDTMKQVSLVHEVTDTFPYSSRCSASSVSSSIQPLPQPVECMRQETPVQQTFVEDEVIDHLLFDACSPGAPRFTQDNHQIMDANDSTQSPPKSSPDDSACAQEEKDQVVWRPPQLSQVVETKDENVEQESPRRESLLERAKKRMESKRMLEEATNFSTSNTPGRTPVAEPPPRKMTRRTTEQLSQAKSENSRAVSEGGPKKIVFLRTAVEIDKSTETAVGAIGGKIESKWSNKVEALISNGIVRTTKFMCAINKGLAIFPRTILTDIRSCKSLPRLDDPNLWLADPAGETKYEFNLRESIERARTSPLMGGYDVYCFKNSIGEFTSEELKDLVSTAGGKMISRLPKEMDEIYPEGKGLIVIGSEANKATAKLSGLKFFNKIEFIVDSCMKQKLDFDFARIDV